jgi:hypothetical protein
MGSSKPRPAWGTQAAQNRIRTLADFFFSRPVVLPFTVSGILSLIPVVDRSRIGCAHANLIFIPPSLLASQGFRNLSTESFIAADCFWSFHLAIGLFAPGFTFLPPGMCRRVQPVPP